MKKVTDYAQLDEAICRWIADNSAGHPANSRHLEGIAATLVSGGEPWRLIDRRLQELRKSGRVQYTGRRRSYHGWIVRESA
jgi:hypothetical protein